MDFQKKTTQGAIPEQENKVMLTQIHQNWPINKLQKKTIPVLMSFETLN